MATLNPKTEAEALVVRLRADAQDASEARYMLLLAAQAMQFAIGKASQEADEEKAALVLTARAARTGVTVEDQKAIVAEATGKHPATVSALEVVDSLYVTAAPPKG